MPIRAVITNWNAITVSTVSGGGASPTHFLYYAFTHLAMYNAVVGITGEYELYRWDKHAPTGASPEAAAAAAARRVLTTYFPAQAGNLDTKLAESLAAVPDGGPRTRVSRGECARRTGSSPCAPTMAAMPA